MALTTSSWERPIQGVSQQPPKVRLPGQCTEQINAVSSIVSGLVKRPGTNKVAKLSDSFPENSLFYFYNRGISEKYIVVIPPNSLPRVFDIEGNNLLVEDEVSDDSYLKVDNPVGTFSLSTISDFTFIANNKYIPKASSVKTRGRSSKAIINVQFADYGRKYVITVDGVEQASYETPDGNESWHINKVATSYVAYKLLNGLEDMPGFSVYDRGNVIILEKDDGTDFSVVTRDDADGRDLIAIQGSVKSVSDLPLYAPNDYVVKVVGEGGSTDDDYYLRAEDAGGDVVNWIESYGYGQSLGFDETTLPHALIRDRFSSGEAVFKIKPSPWSTRGVGDNNSNPMPSFIQDKQPITSVGTFQNRLYFTAGESVILSRSNYFFDFFRKTVRAQLDGDPIDIYADTNEVNILDNSSVLDGDVVFFSANGQFLLSGSEAVTKENATLQSASSFENIRGCKPVASGDVIFFAFEYGAHTGVREFFTDSFTDTKRARPITDHVDEYIEGTAVQMTASTNKNQLLVMATDKRTLYLYNYLWQGQDRVQSSWSKWEMTGDVRYIKYDSELLYLLIDRSGSLYLERIALGDPDDVGMTFPVRLDARGVYTATYSEGAWSFILPDLIYPLDSIIVVRGSDCLDSGVTVPYERSGHTVTLREDIAEPSQGTAEVIVGTPYTMKYEPTMPFIKDRNGRVIDTDRLILNDVNINYDKTGITEVEVTNEWGSVREYSFNGRNLGAPNNLVGFAPIRPGQFSFPVRQDSDRVTFKLITDSHIPFQLRGMEWRGRFNQRGRRV